MTQHGALHVRRRRLLLAVLVGGAVVLLGRGFQVQVLEAAEWQGRAVRQQRDRVPLPAERGTIYDRTGVPLAATREMVRVSVAPREVVDRAGTAEALRKELGLDRAGVRRALDRSRRWVVIPGLYEPPARETLEPLRGVYLERVLQRFRPHGEVALELLGRTTAEGRPLGGLELELDSLLRGEDGFAVVRRDARGEPIPGALVPVRKPRPGRSVYLTLDVGLQEIAEGALDEALAENDATGGDLMFVDPRTGEVLAAASRRPDGSRVWRGVTDPYEPGSTMKPFVMSALLDRDRVALTDSVFAENGSYRLGARTISDVENLGWLTAAEVLQHSSNIGMSKLSARLQADEQYATLRDFGFGTPTGILYPSESGGRLERPERWSAYTQASMAMGYEISVTPLQMTMAYGAIANGGRLLEPRLVREIRDEAGKVLLRTEPRELRRVIRAETAEKVAGVLADVVEGGTGRRAGLGDFHVAGKTGTARVFENGRYHRDEFTASFAGFFPAQDPQLVFLVKLDRGSHYGGAVAAPVTRSTLAAALAARTSPLNRAAMISTVPDPGGTVPTPVAWSGGWPAAASGPFVFRMDAGPPRRAPEPSALRVPDVRGENARDAAARLHAAGFRVALLGAGRVLKTAPAPGSAVGRGGIVRLTLGGTR